MWHFIHVEVVFNACTHLLYASWRVKMYFSPFVSYNHLWYHVVLFVLKAIFLQCTIWNLSIKGCMIHSKMNSISSNCYSEQLNIKNVRVCTAYISRRYESIMNQNHTSDQKNCRLHNVSSYQHTLLLSTICI